MASDLSAYFGNKIVRWLNGNAMPSAPSALYTALFNGNPKTTGTEVTTTVRAGGRLAVTFAAVASGADHLLTSDAAVDYGNSAGVADLSHIGLFDASSGGNLLASKPISGGAVSLVVGTGVKFNAGAITFNVGADT